MVTSIVAPTSILYFLPLVGILKTSEYDYYDYSGYHDCMDSKNALGRRDYTWDEADEICSEENRHIDGWQIRVRW